MRYSVYKYVRSLAFSLVEATEYVKNKSENISILADCADAIFTLKKVLMENREEIIQEFDDFYDKICKINELYSDGKEYINIIKELPKLANNINEYCLNNVKYKFRIVFFAELGSKWDSLDSLYRAYKEREDCEVLVVLSPIFRAVKMPNGEIKSDVIYTDYLTEMGIDHIPFQKYDIKKDLPDLVFTCQPYESVAPEQFWAQNVSPYTRLVYVPYYSVLSMENDEQIFVQCQMPIHKLAWRVICQSEQVKKMYSTYFEDNGEKLIASGLPKWDWVVNMDDREIDFPKEWEKIKDKKIILNNIHYNFGKFNNLEKFVETILSSLEGTNTGCICRFHPMLETIISVYYSEYKKRWEELKTKLINSKNIVIDTNLTYDCAFKFSDILLTSRTSFIPQYLLTKKPIVITVWKNIEEYKAKEASDCFFIKSTKLYPVKNREEGYEKCKEILNFCDTDYDNRMKYLEEVLINRDGNIGQRLANKLIEQILKEDEMI